VAREKGEISWKENKRERKHIIKSEKHIHPKRETGGLKIEEEETKGTKETISSTEGLLVMAIYRGEVQ